MNEKEICKKLCGLGGTSGDEGEAAFAAKEMLEKYMPVSVDTLGNVIGKINETAKTQILLEAHCDRVGLVVTAIDENGFLLVDKVGGLDVRTLIGSEVIVYGAKTLPGVVCSKPPHLLTEADKAAGVEISNVALDIGFSKTEAEQLVQIGDRAIVTAGMGELAGERFFVGALDDRASIAAILLAVESVCKTLKNVGLTVAFTSGEEVGGFGAKTASFGLNPDFAICVDVGFGSDAVCSGPETIELSKGASIGISPVLDKKLKDELVKTAKKHSIPFQHDVMSPRTGTNADNVCVSRGGIKTALLSIPLRNMHSPVEVVDFEDIRLCAKLICSFILDKEEEGND